MGVALLGADPAAGTATNAIQCVGKRHDHAVIFVFVKSRIIFTALDQFKNLARTDFIATSTTDTVGCIQCGYKSGFVGLTAPGDSSDVRHRYPFNSFVLSAAVNLALATAHA